MCLAKRNLSRKSRILLALGNLCMFGGLTMSRFGSDASQQRMDIKHFLAGLLLGIAITFLFAALYNGRPDDQVQR